MRTLVILCLLRASFADFTVVVSQVPLDATSLNSTYVQSVLSGAFITSSGWTISDDVYINVTQCNPGYVSGSGFAPCSTCALGSYPSAQFNCSYCPSGTYSIQTSCPTCPAGTYSSLGATSCVSCGAGTYSSASNSSQCQLCSAGKISTAIALTSSQGCQNCSAGTYSAPNASLCLPCSSNTFSGAGVSTCSSCMNYSSSPPGSSSCTCLSGYYGGVCQPCSQGTYSSSPGSTVCQLCAPGTYGNASAAYLASFCTPCTQGTYSTGGVSSCSTCSQGTFSNKTSSTVCVACLPGQNQPGTGATACVACSLGYFSPLGGICQACAPGSYGLPSLTSCGACQATAYSSSQGATVCSACGTGTYSLSNFSACLSCPTGGTSGPPGICVCGAGMSPFYASTYMSCPLCSPGTYAPTQNSSQCTPCDAGTYSTQGSSSCSPCSAGSYRPDSASPACAPCSPGYTSPSGASQCTLCPPTFYCVGGAIAQTCPLGSYSLSSGVPSPGLCPLCPSGFFCADPATSEACPAHTSSSEGSTTKLSCLCDQGYSCTYTKTMQVNVTLPLTVDQFWAVRLQFIQALASAAGVDPSMVTVTGVTPVSPGGGGRRLMFSGLHLVEPDENNVPQFSHAVHVHFYVLSPERHVTPHRLLRATQSLGLRPPLRVRIRHTHAVSVLRVERWGSSRNGGVSKRI